MVFGVVETIKPLAFQLERNAWESDFFAMEIAKLQFNENIQTALLQDRTALLQNQSAVLQNQSAVFGDFDLVQCKVTADQIEPIRQLQQLGFQFVEGEADFCLPVVAIKDEEVELEIAESADIAELETLFGEAFLNSRFRQPWFNAEQNRTFYRTWIRKAVLGQFDHLCLLQKDSEGRIQGSVSLRSLDADNARGGLLAVAEHARGKGVAKRLMQSAVSWSARQQHKQLWIATQTGNQAAINLYQKQGRIERISYWFYR